MKTNQLQRLKASRAECRRKPGSVVKPMVTTDKKKKANKRACRGRSFQDVH